MNENPENKSQEEILDKIKSGQVPMRSKAFWIWESLLWTLGILLLAAAGIFLASFVVFAMRASGVWDLPQFGYHGLREFLAFFPWLFVPAVLLFIWLVERFVLHFSFAYRMPVLYSALSIIGLIIVLGLVVSATPLHTRLYQFSRQQHLPFAEGIYKFYGHSRPDDLYIGNVVKINQHSYNILTREGIYVTIYIDARTRYPANTQIQPGDCIEVIGDEQGGNINAFMLKKVPAESTYPFCRELN